MEDVRPGAYDPDERIKDMDLDGVDVSFVYPNQGRALFTVPDTDLLNALFMAYNDWLAEYCRAYPKRLKGIALINVDEVKWAVTELERCRKLGLTGALISVYPIPDRSHFMADYDPLWTAAQDMGIPLSFHADTNRLHLAADQLVQGVDDRRSDQTVNFDHWVRVSLAQMVLAGVFERYPKLQLGSVEHELAWAAHFLERLDYTYTQKAQLEHWYQCKEDMLPSDYCHRNVFLSFQEDVLGRSPNPPMDRDGRREDSGRG